MVISHPPFFRHTRASARVLSFRITDKYLRQDRYVFATHVPRLPRVCGMVSKDITSHASGNRHMHMNHRKHTHALVNHRTHTHKRARSSASKGQNAHSSSINNFQRGARTRGSNNLNVRQRQILICAPNARRHSRARRSNNLNVRQREIWGGQKKS